MKRSGIAIMMSLMFVTLALLFSVTFFISLNSMLTNQKKEYGLVQKNLLYLDSLKMLKSSKELLSSSFLPKDYIAKFDGLKISSDNTKIDIHLFSANSKINFNQYRETNKTDEQFGKFLKSLLANYGVSNADYFLELLNSSKTDDSNKTKLIKKISSYGLDYSDEYFYSFGHFSKLVDFYCKTTGDYSIKKVPWDELFIFIPKEMGGFIDCEMMTAPLKQELSRQYGQDSVGCDSGGQFKIRRPIPADSYYILVEMAFDINGASENLKYYFDLKTESVYVIE